MKMHIKPTIVDVIEDDGMWYEPSTGTYYDKDSLEPVVESKRLDEAAKEHAQKQADKVWGEPDPYDYTDHSGCREAHANYEEGLRDGFRAGAKWMESQDYTHIDPSDDAKQAAIHYMEDCEEVDDFIRRNIDDIAERYFCKGAEWQKAQLTKLPDDVNKAAKQYAREYTENDNGNGGDDWEDDIRIAFEAGVKYQQWNF